MLESDKCLAYWANSWASLLPVLRVKEKLHSSNCDAWVSDPEIILEMLAGGMAEPVNACNKESPSCVCVYIYIYIFDLVQGCS